MIDGRSSLERIARSAAGRLTALLMRRSGDLAWAQDAVSIALLSALERWPEEGVPDDPEAWLYRVARRALLTEWRKREVRRRHAGELAWLEALEAERESATSSPDERLPLLFVCAHPAIAPELRAPLMLQTVLSLTAEDLADLMGVSPKTMGQRLWRAKVKIREAGIPFAVPSGQELPARLGSVLDALYGLYGIGWMHDARARLADDALWLSALVAELLPGEPEASGLRALLLYVESRRRAGRAGGAYVPLAEQDPRAWDDDAIARADAALRAASRAEAIGPFQLEAAIQSALVHGLRRGDLDHGAIETLYDGLVALAPTLGAQVGRAAARAEHHGADGGLRALDAIEHAERFQPWWAVRASLLAKLGRPDAEAAYAKAIELAREPALEAFLEHRSARGAPRSGGE